MISYFSCVIESAGFQADFVNNFPSVELRKEFYRHYLKAYASFHSSSSSSDRSVKVNMIEMILNMSRYDTFSSENEIQFNNFLTGLDVSP